MAVANIIGSGVYKKIAPMAAELPASGWVLICWIVAGIISLMGALCNAEVAGLLADTGGEYVYYQVIYNRFAGFIFGWSLFSIIQTAAISSLAYVFAQSLNALIPLPALLPSLASWHLAGFFYPFDGFQIKLTAIALILILTWINSRGIRTGAGLSTAILLLVITGLSVLICFGLGRHGSGTTGIWNFHTVSGSPIRFSAFFTALLAAFWAYQGWAVVGYIGGEVKNARRNIPRGIAAGVLIVVLIYLLANATYLSLLPIEALEAIYRSQNGIVAVEAVRVFWGNGGAQFMSLLILVTTLGATHATILVSCRPYYAMARDGLFFPAAGRLNRRLAPSGSLWMQGIWACLLVLSGSFDQLTDMIIFAVFIYYGATTLGVFILRRKMPDAPRPYRVWGYPWVPGFVILFSAALFANTIFARPREAALGMILMCSGIPLYYYFLRKKRSAREVGTRAS
jgi:APA family basic amino acid/polyamine antiporter